MTESRRLPAEWEPQSAIMLTWPHAETDWADQLPQLDRLYLKLCATISRFQRLIVVCHDAPLQTHIQKLLNHSNIDSCKISLLQANCNDTWARDHAPLTCLDDDQAILLNFRFNGWGGKYPAMLDNEITPTITALPPLNQTPVENIALVLEGGAVETDGFGTLLATRSSVITKTRNPGLKQHDIESLLNRKLALRRFLWLDHGLLDGDDTDGHIDTLARFVSCDTIVYATANPGDADFNQLQAMEQELRGFRTSTGKAYRLIPLPPVTPQYDDEGTQLPAGYANFLIINGAVLVPTYSAPSDQAAIDCLQACFPDREIIAIDCRPLIRQNGSLHCITMQFPAALKLA